MRQSRRRARRLGSVWMVALAVVGLDIGQRGDFRASGVAAAYAQTEDPHPVAPVHSRSYVALEYVVPPGCPTRAEFADAVRLLTARVAFVADAPRASRKTRQADAAAPGETRPTDETPREVTLWEVAIAKRGADWRGRVGVGVRSAGARANRDLARSEVTGTSCVSVIAALALTAALSSDPDAGSTRGGASEGTAVHVPWPSSATSPSGGTIDASPGHTATPTLGLASPPVAPEPSRLSKVPPIVAAVPAIGSAPWPAAAHSASATALAVPLAAKPLTPPVLPVLSAVLGGRGLGALAASATLRAALSRNHMEAGAGARYTFTRVARSAAPIDTAPFAQTGSLRVHQFVVTPHLCWQAKRFGRALSGATASAFAPSRFTLQLCVEGEFGITQAKAAATVNASTVQRGWASVGPSVLLRRWVHARWAAQLGLGIQFNTTRADYILAPNTVLLRTPAATPWLELGVVWK